MPPGAAQGNASSYTHIEIDTGYNHTPPSMLTNNTTQSIPEDNSYSCNDGRHDSVSAEISDILYTFESHLLEHPHKAAH